jgi:ribonuclease G
VDEAKAEFNVASRQDEPIDVIVLPGESLAKYRSRPAIVEPAPAPVAAFAAAAEPSDPLEPSDEEIEIEEEAAEIKISDQVFSHQPTAEIDPPLEPAPAREDALGRAASYLGVDRATHSDALEEERLRVEKFLTDPSPANLPEPDESELLAADESLPDVEDLAPEIEEALENGIDEPYFAATVDVEPPAPQSAVVRDQGNRSLHRAPRRMRRRRGGSGRFNQGGPSNSAAAPSPQPEQRPENRAEAPVVEEHASERPDRGMPSISELLKPGQEIIVQIAKEPLHFPHCLAWALCGLHAQRGPLGRFAQSLQRRGAAPAQAYSTNAS